VALPVAAIELPVVPLPPSVPAVAAAGPVLLLPAPGAPVAVAPVPLLLEEVVPEPSVFVVPPEIPVPVLSVAVLPVGDPFIVVLSVLVVVDEELLSPQAIKLIDRIAAGMILMIFFMTRFLGTF
jgi:hypothetical protein